MNIERGFIFANCSAPNRPALPGRPSTWMRDDVGLRQQLVEGADRGGRCRGRAGRRCRRRSPGSRATRRGWRAGCRCCRSRRCRGCGRGPRGCPAPTCPRSPRASARSSPRSRRASAMISPMTSSTTLRVLEYGALKAATPRSGRGSQVDLVGADAEGADREQVGRVLEHALGDLGVGADARPCVLPWRASIRSSSPREPERVCTMNPLRSKTSVATGWMFSSSRTSCLVTEQAYEGVLVTGRSHPRCDRRSPARPGTAAGSARSRRPRCRG